MKNGKLAIVLPTYRFDATARHCIETVASMGGNDIDVFIGDNSVDPAKWAFLNALSKRTRNCHVFCHETNIGGSNAPFLLKRTNHEFLALASDDDVFTPDYFLSGLELLQKNADCAAAGGLFLALTPQNGGLQISVPNTYPQDTPVARIAAYYYWGNSLCYTVYRSAVTDRLNDYFEDRPFWPSYMDQFIAYSLLCAGKYLTDPERKLFVYNNQHWGNPAKAIAQDGKWFAASGLPAEFVYINRLCWTADIVHFFNSTYRPANLSDAESDAIVDSLFCRMFVQEFSIHLGQHAAEIGELFQHASYAVDALKRIVRTPWRDVDAFLGLFVTILGAFNHTVADNYAAFVRNSVRPGNDLMRHACRELV